MKHPRIKMFLYREDLISEFNLSKITGKDVSIMKEILRKRLRRFGIGVNNADFEFDIKVRLTEIRSEEDGRRLKDFTG